MPIEVEKQNAKRRVLLQPVGGNTPLAEGWTAVEVPIDCNYFGMRNAGAVAVQQSTDPANSDSFDVLEPGWSDPITSPSRAMPRFPKGMIVMYLRVVGGSEPGDVRLHFVW